MNTMDTDGLPTPRRYWAVAAIWLAMTMAVLDSSIANIALPTIAHEFGASPEASIWVINAYQIAVTMVLLPIAALGEIHGYRFVYGIGLALFVAASLACTLADGLISLALARFAQGLGAAGVMAINGALIRFTFPRASLGRGIGYNVLVVSVASAAGPSIAAAVLSVGSWRWLFAVNVPIGVLSLVIGQRCLPDVPGSRGAFSVVSAVLNVVMFGAAFLAASDVALGVFDLHTLVEVAAAVVAGVLLVRRVRGEASPMIPLDLLRVAILRLSYLTSICAFAAQMIALVSLPFYLQTHFRLDHLHIGLIVTAWPVAVAVTAPIAGRLVERVPAGVLGGIGLVVLAAGLGVLVIIPPGASIAWLFAAMAACGGGFGLFQAPNNRVMLGTAPPGRSGAAAGMLATARLLGQTTGAVLVAFVFRLGGTTTSWTYVVGALLAAAAAFVSMRRRSPSG